MLKTYLSTQPLTRFVLIEDSLQQQGKPLFDYLVNTHVDRPQTTVNYMVFHGSLRRGRERFVDKSNVVVHDFTSNVCGWDADKSETLETIASRLGTKDVVVVDSLVHAVFQCGLGDTYRFLNVLKSQRGVQQIIALLHMDLLIDKEKVRRSFEHLSTLSLSVEPKFLTNNWRVQYTYKKIGGKIVKQIEEFRFEGDNLVSEGIERLDPKKLLEKAIVPHVNPDTLTTFRIGLTDKEKEDRDQVVLPYLPNKEAGGVKDEGGQIFYQFDEVDDWDEEDPDDDLDI